ncbi:hypothetical protein [Marinobacter sp. ATCH36]|uniref:PA4575 family protein n=1 Tax=Marinobacter sp. ATCH36 TaxID=2945106 RepID=UPI0020202831|nr:hypothetical protein [Marinobacter sp. ATCH36]
MKLHYFHGRGPLRSLVMLRDQRRVELFIKPIGDNVWALVALSGSLNGQPEKHRCQGPYRSITQAESVLRSVAGALMGKDYQPQPHDYVVWSVMAQRCARTIRIDRDASAGTFHFDPDQYEPIG